MTNMKVLIMMHVNAGWSHYSSEQRHILCLFLHIDPNDDVKLPVVLSACNNLKENEDFDRVYSLLKLVRLFAPTKSIHSIEAGEPWPGVIQEIDTAVTSLEVCSAAVQKDESVRPYRMAAMVIGQHVIETCKTQVYVPESVYRFINRSCWKSSKGVRISFEHGVFDYRDYGDKDITVILPKACTVQLIYLEDLMANRAKDHGWDWQVVYDALDEACAQVTKSHQDLTDASVFTDASVLTALAQEKPTFVLNRNVVSQTNRPVTTIFISRSALLYINHAPSHKWTAKNGVSFYCNGAADFIGGVKMAHTTIALDCEQGDKRVNIDATQWDDCDLTPEQVRDALAELSQLVWESHSESDLADMETF